MCSRLNDVGAVIFKQTARLGVAAADEIFGFLDQAQDVDDALEIALARLGQRELAGRALEQTRAERSSSRLMRLETTAGESTHTRRPAAGHVAGAGDACEDIEVTDGGHRFGSLGRSCRGPRPLPSVLRT